MNKKEHFQTHFIRLALPILQPAKDTTKKENYRPDIQTQIYTLTIKLGKYGRELLDHRIIMWVDSCVTSPSLYQ